MINNVDARTLKAWLQDGDELALLDAQEAGQYGEGHLFLATSVPYSRLEADIERLAPRKGVRLVLCDDGQSGVAERAAKRAAALGYDDIHLLDGGTQAWKAAGFVLYKGVNVPSKTFGELLDETSPTPSVTAQELQRMKDAGEPLIQLDGRPWAEYRKMSIPGAACCPNGELPLRVIELARDPGIPVIVNCAGRTRSILGAQTLMAMGLPNPVYALEDGAQGWTLAGFELDRGASRRYEPLPDAQALTVLQQQADALMRRHGIAAVDARQVQLWLNEEARTTYLLDVRTAEEYAEGHIPGSIHAPGGQLVQATDHWVAVRNARIVLIDGDGEQVRAPMIASWLKQMGHDASVLAGPAEALRSGPSPARAGSVLPALASITPAEVARLQTEGGCRLIDLRASMSHREGHIPGSVWSIRPRLAGLAPGKGAVVLIADDTLVARAAAVDLMEAGGPAPLLLEGGFGAWDAAGLQVVTTPAHPPDSDCIDYLFFVHDRHTGNLESARNYLAWEHQLVAQMDEQERSVFARLRATAGD